MSCKGTKNNDICHRVTADTVSTVDPADPGKQEPYLIFERRAA